MEQIFSGVLSMSLTGALTGLVLLLIHPLTKKWFSRKWNYYVWLLVIVRLLLPFGFETANSLRITVPVPQAVNSALSVSKTKTEGAGLSVAEPEGSDASLPEISDFALPKPEPERRDIGRENLNWLLVLCVIWLLGAGISLFIKIKNYRHFASCIRNASREITDSRVLALIRETAERISMKRIPIVRESEAVSGPITLGLRRAVIILPEGFLSGPLLELPALTLEARKEDENLPQLSLVLHHEFIHVKRRDLWYKWLYQILLCVHWFNPVLYLVGKMLNIDCELACDEAVLRKLTGDGKKAYGNILINAAEQNVNFKGIIFSTTLLERRQDLKERLKGIIHYKKQGKVTVLVSLCMIACLFYLSACGSVRVSQDTERASHSASYAAEDYENSEVKSSTFFTALSNLFEGSADSFLAEGGTGNKYGIAWKMYDDDSMIAGEDDHDQWRAFNYCGGGNELTVKGFVINGTESILIVESPKEKKVKVESSYELVEGKFKIVHVKPGGSVETITDTGEWGIYEVTLEKGRNAIKVVGRGAKLKELKVSFQNLRERDFEAVYGSEQEEYAAKALDSIRAGNPDKKKVFESLPYMEDETVSEVLAEMLERKVSLTSEEICNLLIYSDTELSTGYLVKAAEEGYFKPDKEMVEHMMPYLGGGARGNMLIALGADLDWEMICHSLPYMDDDETEGVLLKYMGNGNAITFSQYSQIMPYLSDDVIEGLDRYMENK